MKIKSAKKKNLVTKSNWAEDNVSESGNADVIPVKKKKELKKTSIEKPTKPSKKDKVKKKVSKKQSKDSSDEDEYGASLDKLKTIDPEFYKVIMHKTFCIFPNENHQKYLLFNSFWNKTTKNC